MFEVIFLTVLCLFCLAFLGELSISFNPFSFKLMAWDKMIAIVLFIIGFVFLRYHYERLGYDRGREDTIEYYENKKTNKFEMILYRGNSAEVRQSIEDLGFLPISSPAAGGYILVAGNRYSTISCSSVDEEDFPEVYDCSDSLNLFIEKCQHLIQSCQ